MNDDVIMTTETDPIIGSRCIGRTPTPMDYALYLCLTSRCMPPLEVQCIPAPGGMKAQARINHSRWIVDCPYCHSAAIASRNSPIFWCVECRMRASEGNAIAVVFPADADEIERLLLLRPEPDTRHWFPYESVTDLRNENHDHKIGV